MMANELRVSFEGTKYTIVCHDNGHVELLRYDEPWVLSNQLLYGKMFIAIACEVDAMRKELEELRRYKRNNELSSEHT